MNVEVIKTLTIEELSAEIKKAVSEATANLTNEIAKVRHENEILKATIDDLKAKIEGNYNKIIDVDESLSEKIDEVESDYSDLSYDVEDLKDKFEDLPSIEDTVSDHISNIHWPDVFDINEYKEEIGEIAIYQMKNYMRDYMNIEVRWDD